MGRTVRDNTPEAGVVKAKDLNTGAWVIDYPKSAGSQTVKVQHASDVFRRPGETKDRVAVVFEDVTGSPFYIEVDAEHPYHVATDAHILAAKEGQRRIAYVAKLHMVADLIDRHALPVDEYAPDLSVARKITLKELQRIAELTGTEIGQDYGHQFSVRVPAVQSHEFAAEWKSVLTLDEIFEVAPDKVGRCDEHGLWLITPRTPAGTCPTCSDVCTALGCGHPIGEHGVDGCTATIGAGQHTSRCQCRKTDDALKADRP